MNAIEFDNVGKLYRLGLVGTGTLSHDLNRWWRTKVLRQEDPYLRIGETNDRAAKGDSQFVWALKDINFKVEEGDVVGIIGKNGAGKSTLLKLLSRVTAPTVGTIRARGRIASLLEVGTGFHPELTGRENVYMNGSIMGMTRAEITRKLDEIVDFAGVARYIDTPVKRYSSGMKVRLGFAVAAFLEPEILVVDEVLAVGDAEFQKKAIGKMQDVATGQGRTVLFVSHNMAAVQSLCRRGILLENGTVTFEGGVEDAINRYMATSTPDNGTLIKDKISLNKPFITIDSINVNDSESSIQNIPSNADYIDLKIKGHMNRDCYLNVCVRIKQLNNVVMAKYYPHEALGENKFYSAGDFFIHEQIALPDILSEGEYICDIFLNENAVEEYVKAYDCVSLSIQGRTPGFGFVCKQGTSGFFGLHRYNQNAQE